MARNYAALFHEYLDEMADLTDAEFGRLARALLVYSSTGGFPALNGNERLFKRRVIAQEDRVQESYNIITERNRENGKSGGRPKKPEEPRETHENPEKPKQTQKTQSEIKIETKTKAKAKNISPPAGENAPARKRYGEYSNVLLSDEDLGKLKTEFPGDWEQRIERLSGYIASTGKSYKNHLATIRNWARKDAEKGDAGNGRAKSDPVADAAARWNLPEGLTL